MNELLTSNEWHWRLARTIAQGILGVVVANVDVLMGAAVLDPTWRVICVALVMAVLSPVIAELGAHATLRRTVRTMADSDAERARWEELREEGREAAAPDDFEPDEGEDDGFEEMGV